MKIREVASGLAFPEGPVAMDDGSVLVVEIASGRLVRVLPSGKVQTIAAPGGGPNGAAIGPDGHVYVCNNGGMSFLPTGGDGLRPGPQPPDYSGGRLERINLATGRVERLFDTVDGAPLSGPNDLVFGEDGSLWFTDLGKIRARDIDRGGIFYSGPGYARARAVAYPVTTPNGIGLSPDGQKLYFAETEGARVWAYTIEGPGHLRHEPWPSPNGGRMLIAAPGGHYQRFDSMAVDSLGNLIVATLIHGGLTILSPNSQIYQHLPLPDRFPTNACFGGRDLRTLYVTLSGHGRLIAIDDWPIPGLPLAFRA